MNNIFVKIKVLRFFFTSLSLSHLSIYLTKGGSLILYNLSGYTNLLHCVLSLRDRYSLV